MALSSAASLSNTFGRPRLFFAQLWVSVVMVPFNLFIKPASKIPLFASGVPAKPRRMWFSWPVRREDNIKITIVKIILTGDADHNYHFPIDR
ncbi:hypothetical protein U5R87_001344 [Cronobacter dublinensis]|nr:hypothetical protein [Cronobacter dublinensis]EMA8654179.1 hypothetical protein [Cronobacter dublinensis]